MAVLWTWAALVICQFHGLVVAKHKSVHLRFDPHPIAREEGNVDPYDPVNWGRVIKPGEDFNIYRMKSKEFAKRIVEQREGWTLVRMLIGSLCISIYPQLKERRTNGGWVQDAKLELNRFDKQCIEKRIAPFLDTMFEEDSGPTDMASLEPWLKYRSRRTLQPKYNLPSPSFPALDGVVFRDACDLVQQLSSLEEIWWRRTNDSYHVRNLLKNGMGFDRDTVRNRSLVFFPFAKAEQKGLREFVSYIEERGLYVFILSHCHADVILPVDVLSSPNVLRFFAANHFATAHSVGQGGKGVPLPLGLGHNQHHRHFGIIETLMNLQDAEFTRPSKKEGDVLAGYYSKDDESSNLLVRIRRRQMARNRLRMRGFNVSRWSDRLKYPKLMAELRKYNMYFAPYGMGYDTYRMYECWLFGVVPVVNRKLHIDLAQQLPIVMAPYGYLTPQKLSERFRRLESEGRHFNRN